MRLFLLLSICIATLADASAATFTVNLTQDRPDAVPGDGKCSYLAIAPDNTAVCTLRAAIMEANATQEPDLVILQAGEIYTLTIAGRGEEAGATGDLDINRPLAINAGFSGRATIDAAGVDRVFDIKASDVILSGLDVTGGDPRMGEMGCYPGGGISISSAKNVRLNFLRVYGNAGCMGAVHANASDVDLQFSEVFSNASSGISANQGSVDFKIYKSSIYENSGNQIDIQNPGKSLTLDHSTISAVSGGNGIRLPREPRR